MEAGEGLTFQKESNVAKKGKLMGKPDKVHASVREEMDVSLNGNGKYFFWVVCHVTDLQVFGSNSFAPCLLLNSCMVCLLSLYPLDPSVSIKGLVPSVLPSTTSFQKVSPLMMCPVQCHDTVFSL